MWSDPAKDIAFPASVIEMLHGELGQPPGGWPEVLQAKALKGVAPINVRPGSLLKPADLSATHREAHSKIGRLLSETELSSYLMYPKVFADYALIERDYGPVSVLPTPVFFYGMQPGEELTIEMEKGKALVVLLQTIGETDEEGQVKVFFELNGQQRIVRIPNRSAGGGKAQKLKAEDGNERHIAAPMPGVISTVAVTAGQAIKAGDVLLSIEAMKMETALHAPRDGTVESVMSCRAPRSTPRTC